MEQYSYLNSMIKPHDSSVFYYNLMRYLIGGGFMLFEIRFINIK